MAERNDEQVRAIDQCITADLVSAGLLSLTVESHRAPIAWRFGPSVDGPTEWEQDQGIAQVFTTPTYVKGVTSTVNDPTFRRVVAMLEPNSTLIHEVQSEEWTNVVVRVALTLARVGVHMDVSEEAWRTVLSIPVSALVRRYLGLDTSNQPVKTGRHVVTYPNTGTALFLSNQYDSDEEELRVTVHEDEGLEPQHERPSWREHLITVHGLEPKPGGGDFENTRSKMNWHIAKRFAMTECFDACTMYTWAE